MLCLFTGDYRHALKYHKQELSLSEGVSDQMGLGIACRKVGECLCELGDYEQAVQYQKRHLEVATRMGEWEGEVVSQIVQLTLKPCILSIFFPMCIHV